MFQEYLLPGLIACGSRLTYMWGASADSLLLMLCSETLYLRIGLKQV